MPKHFFRRYLPDAARLRRHRSLRFALGDLVHDPNLWHLNRRSVSGGFAIGLFMAWIPLPIQMGTAGLLALLFRVNLPLSVVLVWVSNPLTMGPMYWFGLRIGNALLGERPERAAFEPSLRWLVVEFHRIWEPLFLGCVLLGLLSAGLGYLGVRLAWRVQVIRHLHQRRVRAQRQRFNRPGTNDRR